ncbi:MAG: metallophosphoesterase [Bacteroidetes bacterium]|nr:metallophosphoesterase [Bacteroidota bacterium]
MCSLGLISCAPASTDSVGAAGTPTQVLRGAYLQQVTPTSIVIRWRTNIPTSSRVVFGKSIAYGKEVISTNDTTEHIIQLTGLSPSTTYYYAIGSESEILQGDSLNSFITAPAPGIFSPVRIWATGDFGSGSQMQRDVRDAYKNYSQVTTNLWIWLGDNAYASGTDSEYQSYVFDVYPEQLKQFPLYPAPGNHDYGNIGYLSAASFTNNFNYFSIFTVPQNGEAGGIPSGTPKYYSYNYSNIHFISLDSYGALNTPGSPMYEWLVKDLSTNSQRWTIVYFHHPPYTKGTHNSDTEMELIDMRTHLVPLLETFKVDLVLNGHSHVNERSYLLKGHYGLSTTFDSSMRIQPATNDFIKKSPYAGTIYAICGTSGQNAGPPMSDAPMPCMYFNDFTSNCSLILDVHGDRLTGKYLSTNGEIKDEFSITKTGLFSAANQTNHSCEISYHPGTSTIYFTMFLTESANLKVSLYNLLGEKIQDFEQIPVTLSSGYHVQSVEPNKFVNSNGVYLIKVMIGNEMFSKKIFIDVKP